MLLEAALAIAIAQPKLVKTIPLPYDGDAYANESGTKFLLVRSGDGPVGKLMNMEGSILQHISAPKGYKLIGLDRNDAVLTQPPRELSSLGGGVSPGSTTPTIYGFEGGRAFFQDSTGLLVGRRWLVADQLGGIQNASFDGKQAAIVVRFPFIQFQKFEANGGIHPIKTSTYQVGLDVRPVTGMAIAASCAVDRDGSVWYFALADSFPAKDLETVSLEASAERELAEGEGVIEMVLCRDREKYARVQLVHRFRFVYGQGFPRTSRRSLFRADGGSRIGVVFGEKALFFDL